MFCKNCGKQVPDNAKFCGECGAALEKPMTLGAPVTEDLAVTPPVENNTAVIADSSPENTENSKPEALEEATAKDIQASSVPGDAPAYEDPKPIADAPNPTAGYVQTSQSNGQIPGSGYNQNPQQGGQSPAGFNQNPQYGGQTPAGYNQNPQYGGQTPTGYNQDPQYGGQTPAGYNQNPQYGGQTPIGYNQNPQYGGQTPTGYNQNPQYGAPAGYGQPQQPVKKKSHKGLIIFLIIFLVIALAAGTVAILSAMNIIDLSGIFGGKAGQEISDNQGNIPAYTTTAPHTTPAPSTTPTPSTTAPSTSPSGEDKSAETLELLMGIWHYDDDDNDIYFIFYEEGIVGLNYGLSSGDNGNPAVEIDEVTYTVNSDGYSGTILQDDGDGQVDFQILYGGSLTLSSGRENRSFTRIADKSDMESNELLGAWYCEFNDELMFFCDDSHMFAKGMALTYETGYNTLNISGVEYDYYASYSRHALEIEFSDGTGEYVDVRYYDGDIGDGSGGGGSSEPNPQSQLVGTWYLNVEETGWANADGDKEIVDAMIEAFKNSSFTYTFNEDGTFKMVSNMDGNIEESTGTWTADDYEIIATDNTGTMEIEYEIKNGYLYLELDDVILAFTK